MLESFNHRVFVRGKNAQTEAHPVTPRYVWPWCSVTTRLVYYAHSRLTSRRVGRLATQVQTHRLRCKTTESTAARLPQTYDDLKPVSEAQTHAHLSSTFLFFLTPLTLRHPTDRHNRSTRENGLVPRHATLSGDQLLSQLLSRLQKPPQQTTCHTILALNTTEHFGWQ